MIAAAPSSRPVALTAIALLHAVGIAAIIGGRPVVASAEAATISVHEVAVARSRDVLPAATLETVPVELTVPTVEIADAVPVGDGGCAIADQLQSALAVDHAVRMALDVVPLDRRSMANAVMVWNGGWADALPSVRRAVVAQIEAAPAACRDVVVTGPRLLVIPAGSQPVVLAFGSGQWKWADILSAGVTKNNGKT